MNIMEFYGYKVRIEYDPDLDQLLREILGLTGSADLYGKTSAGLRKEFRDSLKVFLDVREEQGIGSTESDPIDRDSIKNTRSQDLSPFFTAYLFTIIWIITCQINSFSWAVKMRARTTLNTVVT